MQTDSSVSGTTRMRRHGDIDWATQRPQQIPKDGGTSVTEHGTGTARERRRHPALLMSGPDMTNRIYAPVNAVQMTGANPTQHGVIAEPCRSQLLYRDNAVSLSGDPRDELIRWVEFLGYTPNKSTRVLFLPFCGRRAAGEDGASEGFGAAVLGGELDFDSEPQPPGL